MRIPLTKEVTLAGSNTYDEQPPQREKDDIHDAINVISCSYLNANCSPGNVYIVCHAQNLCYVLLDFMLSYLHLLEMCLVLYL